jgi:hypothetical protein
VTLGNDPLGRLRPGGGIYYLNYGYDGFRAGRIEQMLRQRLAAGHKVSMADMEAMQADIALMDAEYFVPHITQAFADAKTSSVPQLAALVPEVCMPCDLRRPQPAGRHHGHPCPCACCISSSSGSAAGWSCLSGHRPPRTPSYLCYGTRSPCCAVPIRGPG